MPYHELIEVDITTLSDAEIRAYVQVVDTLRGSAQTRRSVAKKSADKITGKSKSLDISDLL